MRRWTITIIAANSSTTRVCSLHPKQIHTVEEALAIAKKAEQIKDYDITEKDACPLNYRETIQWLTSSGVPW